jgi:hypothetical protein
VRFLWEFGRKNVDALVAKYGTVAFVLPGLFQSAVGGLKEADEVRDAEQFAKAHQGAIFYRPLLQGIEKRKSRLAAASRAFDFQALLEYVNRDA